MSNMSNEERNTCRNIIHAHAVAAAAGNMIPVPGAGFAADTITMTTMAMALAAVFGRDIPESVAKAAAISALKKTMLKQPIKVVVKEVSKMFPLLGQLVAPAVSITMLEAAGWLMAEEMAAQRNLTQRYKAA